MRRAVLKFKKGLAYLSLELIISRDNLKKLFRDNVPLNHAFFVIKETKVFKKMFLYSHGYGLLLVGLNIRLFSESGRIPVPVPDIK
jgi:hypothetical protein